jgi:Protein of unknown function (DUF3618)
MTAPEQGTSTAPAGSADGAPTPDRPVPSDPAELARDIEQTRERLGETVEALAAKTDVKARAKEKASQVSSQLREKGTATANAVTGRVKGTGTQVATTARDNPAPMAVTAAASAALGALLLAIGWRRGHG